MNAATAYGLARLTYSGGLLLAPARVAAPWLGPAAGRGPTQVAVRGLAARDAALAAGVILARSPRIWLLLCAVGDLSDVAATLAAPPADLPPRARPGTIALAGASAVLGLALSRSTRPPPARARACARPRCRGRRPSRCP
jgi:hypothetical protein